MIFSNICIQTKYTILCSTFITVFSESKSELTVHVDKHKAEHNASISDILSEVMKQPVTLTSGHHHHKPVLVRVWCLLNHLVQFSPAQCRKLSCYALTLHQSTRSSTHSLCGRPTLLLPSINTNNQLIRSLDYLSSCNRAVAFILGISLAAILCEVSHLLHCATIISAPRFL